MTKMIISNSSTYVEQFFNNMAILTQGRIVGIKTPNYLRQSYAEGYKVMVKVNINYTTAGDMDRELSDALPFLVKKPIEVADFVLYETYED